MEKQNNYFASLTGVRALAAYMVFIHHYNPFLAEDFGNIIHDFFQEFHIGVTFFFVLSGFLITNRYYKKPNFSFKKYMINRIARIYPMYFLLTTVTFGYLIFKSGLIDIGFIRNYILNITFLRGYFDYFKYSGIAQGWSLTVEETFYILAPCILYLVKKSKYNLLFIPLCSMAIGIILVTLFKDIDFYGFMNSNEFLFNYTFFGRCFEFIIGAALAIMLIDKPMAIKTNYLTYVGLVNIILSICLLVYLKGNNDFGIRHPIGKLTNTFLLPLFGIAPFYLGLIKETTIISKVFSSKLFILLGKSSYVFYLIHMGIIYDSIYSYINNKLILFILLNFISIILFKFIEDPINNYIRRKINKTSNTVK